MCILYFICFGKMTELWLGFVEIMAYQHGHAGMVVDPTAPFYHSDDARRLAAITGGAQPPAPRPSTSTGDTLTTTKPAGAHHSAIVIPSNNDHTLVRVNSTKPAEGYTRWSWGSTVFATIALFVCCSYFSFTGLLCSVLSYIDHKSGDARGSERKRKWSYVCTIVAFLLGLGVVIALVVMATTQKDDFKNWLCDEGYNDMC